MVGTEASESMIRVVIWLDPGKTTGIAFYDTVDGYFTSSQYDFAATGEYLDGMMTTWNDLAIGWEQYIIAPGHSGTAAFSLEVIGMTRWLAHHHDVLVLPAVPSAARKLGSDDKLKKLGWYTPGTRHANDAAAHMLAWLLRTKKLLPELQNRLCTLDT